MANYSIIEIGRVLSVVVYYLFVATVTGIFYLFYHYTSALSKPLILAHVFWVMSICFLFPGIVSILSPFPALVITLALAVFGGYSICSRAENHILRKQPPLLLLPPGKGETEYLSPKVAREREQKEELLLTEETVVLDDLINGAFQAKKENNLKLAMEQFKSALNLVEDSSLEGLIYTELVYLYREMGQYLEAAKLAETFAVENISTLPPALSAQFERLAAYLKKIDELLGSAKLPNLPFSQVPHLIKLRAEEVLKE